MIRRLAVLLYGTLCYLMFLGIFLYLVGFLCDVVVPRSINAPDPDSGNSASAVVVNVLLLALFALQHSGMARPGFKKWWTTIIPRPIERSTYVLFTNLVFALLFWQWRPLPEVLWNIENLPGRIALYALFAAGIGIVLLSTFLIDHFELFGLKQAVYYFTGREFPHGRFRTPLLYRYVRHPLMVGFLIAFWATPLMTAGRLLFAAVSSAYILVAIRIEERDLIAHFGDDYCRYRQTTPMLIPRPPAERAP